jgi:ankyrin repeat protein
VQLFNPKDLCPCVEDPQKLTYLDLEGCFGDICDLSQCTYLKKGASKETAEDAEMALHTMLTERWGYDDISDEEVDDEDDNVQDSEDEIQNPVAQNDNHQSQYLGDRGEGIADTTDDETDYERESIDGLRNIPSDVCVISLSQESATVLHRESPPGNPDMIQYYLEHVTKGGCIHLTSVEGMKDDVLL